MITLNKGLIDWLTLTTWEPYQQDAIYRSWVDGNDTGKAGKRMQYQGHAYNGVFFGAGTQQRKPHYLMQASGEMADAFARVAMGSPVNCTRIDLQVTIPKPLQYDARQVYDELLKWDAPGRKRQLSIVQSGDGYDTIYIGHRTSDAFARLYVKPTDEELDVLRLEFEYKGDHAMAVWGAVGTSPNYVGACLAGEIERLPALKFGLSERFLAATGTQTHKPDVVRLETANSTVLWLRNQVAPAIARLVNDHDNGDHVRDLLRQWFNAYCTNDDK